MVTTKVRHAPEHSSELMRLSLGRLLFTMQVHMEEAVERLQIRRTHTEPCMQGRLPCHGDVESLACDTPLA